MDQQLLWISLDADSIGKKKQLYSVSRSAINAHSQRSFRASAKRNSISQQEAAAGAPSLKKLIPAALPTEDSNDESSPSSEGSSSSATGSSSASASASTAASSVSEGSDAKPLLEDDVEEIIRSSILLPRNAIAGQATDPFASSAIRLDSSMHGLLDFFLAQVHPTFWDARMFVHSWQGLEPYAAAMIRDSIADRARLFALMACISAYLDRVGLVKGQSTKSGTYTHNALVAIRVQVGKQSFTRGDALYAIATMAIAATLARDQHAAFAHLTAAKQLVDLEGGVDKIDTWVLQGIIRADLGRAVATLSAPIFNLPRVPTPGMTLITTATGDPTLQSLACKALLDSVQNSLPTGLREAVYDIVQQGMMLVYCWKKPSDVEEIMSQALYTGSAAIYQLLAMDFSDAKNGSEREKFALTEREKLEVSRLAMTLWLLLMRNLARKGNGARGVMDHIPVFKISPADAKKRCWPPGIVELLGAWDATRRPDSRPKQLIRVTQAIEECTEVKLGHFIERVFKIRDGHEKKRVATLWMEDV